MPGWWADAGSGGGWLWAHGSQLIDQIRVTLGEFEGVSASLVHVVDRPSMSADDGFIVHFRMRNGAVGVMQSTAGDRGILVETRVTGSTGTAWIEGVGAKVKVADADGVRTLPFPDDLQMDAAPPLPEGATTTTYEKMITFGVEYGPYVRLAAAFRDRIRGEAIASVPEPATFVDGVAQMAVLDAITSSAAAGGRWTTVGTGHLKRPWKTEPPPACISSWVTVPRTRCAGGAEALAARRGVDRVTWWENCVPGRQDLPMRIADGSMLAVAEVTASFSAPKAPAETTAHCFRRHPRPSQGVLTGRPTTGLLVVWISPREPELAQALRDWGDFVHIRHIADGRHTGLHPDLGLRERGAGRPHVHALLRVRRR